MNKEQFNQEWKAIWDLVELCQAKKKEYENQEFAYNLVVEEEMNLRQRAQELDELACRLGWSTL